MPAISASSVTTAPAGTNESDIVKYARSWVGVPNVHGGNSREGIDCSHLVYQVYSKAGARGIYFMKVPDIKKNKYYTEITSPKPGDLILWKKDVTKNGKTYSLAAHTGICIGNGKFVHTSRDKKMVVVDSISQSPYKDGQPYYVRWSRK
ncbi:MAG TPA: NlpC/P60 family protein [Methanosarcina sp.]|nr:NlpC/P60 family protein [Methanosarcina sp.]